MNTHIPLRPAVYVAIFVVVATALGGKGPRAPYRHPPERRQANMLMLRFQDALAAERWDEALSFCSERVRTNAAKWPTLKRFFNETMPIEAVLEQEFACWSCGTNFYGLFITVSEPGVEPRIDWYWGFVPTAGGWLLDYPPAKLGEYVARKKEAFQERDDRIKQIRQSLESEARVTTTRLTAVSTRFTVGSPMLFRVELVNAGERPIDYMDTGVRYKPLNVMDANKEPIGYVSRPLQIQVSRAELAAGSSVVLADKIDINAGGEIRKPGKYFVQFDSSDLSIGKPLPSQEMGRFGENLPMAVFDFLPATNKFPSNVVQIEVYP